MVLKFKDSLSWKSISLLICSYFGESRSITQQVFFINLTSFGALERQVSFGVLKPRFVRKERAGDEAGGAKGAGASLPVRGLPVLGL